MGKSPTSPLSTLENEILGTIVAAMGDACPERNFVSHGAPAWDVATCDQLTVHLTALPFRKSPGGPTRQSVPQALVTVQIVRCVPALDGAGRPPSAGRLELSAEELADDLWAIQDAIRVAAPSIFGACGDVDYGQAVPLGPAGGRGGYSWPITVTVLGA